METLLLSPEAALEQIELVQENYTEIPITNYYWSNFNSKEVTLIKELNTIVILDKDRDFYRAYYYSDDTQVLERVFESIKEETLVLEFLSREKVPEIDEAFDRSGFKLFSVHKKIVNKTIPRIKTNKDLTYASLDDLSKIYNSLNNNFNRYSDHLPTIEFLENAIKNKNILVYKQEYQIIAYIIFEMKGDISYFGFWFSSRPDNPLIGINLLVNLYGILNDQNIKMAYGWVKDDNFKVIDIHKKFGFYFEGLTNYIFIKNPMNN